MPMCIDIGLAHLGIVSRFLQISIQCVDSLLDLSFPIFSSVIVAFTHSAKSLEKHSSDSLVASALASAFTFSLSLNFPTLYPLLPKQVHLTWPGLLQHLNLQSPSTQKIERKMFVLRRINTI